MNLERRVYDAVGRSICGCPTDQDVCSCGAFYPHGVVTANDPMIRFWMQKVKESGHFEDLYTCKRCMNDLGIEKNEEHEWATILRSFQNKLGRPSTYSNYLIAYHAKTAVTPFEKKFFDVYFPILKEVFRPSSHL